jgi:hypothetical protein
VYYRTQTYRYADAVLNGMVGALKTVPGAALMVTPHVLLYQAGPTPGGTNAVADFTECDFHGYAPATVTLTGPVLLLDGSVAMICSGIFTATTGGPLNPQGMKGYILTDGAAAYYGGEDFVGTLAISAVGQFLQVDVVLPVAPRPSVNA